MGLITGVLTLLTLVIGGICTVLLVGIRTLRDSRDDLEFRVKQLEAERTRDKDTIAGQETAIGFWRSAATGDAKLDQLASKLDEHHASAVKNWVQVNAALGHVGRALDTTNEHLEHIRNGEA